MIRKDLLKVLLVFCFVVCGFRISKAQTVQPFIMDMVHHNPGEPLTETAFSDPEYLKTYGYNGIVVNDFTFAHAALTFDSLNRDIFPAGSKERAWVMAAAERVRNNISRAKKAGLKVYYFTDIVVVPKKLEEIYRDEIVDKDGKITFDRPKTVEIHRIMLAELFEKFPDLDGLVIRTGETYLNNVPYHTGNNPITRGVDSHVNLINFLKDEVAIKRNKKVFYRTWLSAGMHEKPEIYLSVTNQIIPHPNLIFSIKHTKGDFHRTFDFNPTLTLGKHPQIIEIQCQREYEGKGAYPNYIAEGVINGFEEFASNTRQSGYKGLAEIKDHPNMQGVWTWSRGGGWVGPFITNEFWPRLNAFVISRWMMSPGASEEQIFEQFMVENGVSLSSRKMFRELCLLSAKAVLRGHNSATLEWNDRWVWWTRDEFLSGTDGPILRSAFEKLYSSSLLEKAVKEKYEALKLWSEIEALSRKIKITSKDDEKYIRTSSRYGRLLHEIIAEGWNVMALGFVGDKTGKYDTAQIKKSIYRYDQAWKSYRKLERTEPASATLYKPYQFVFRASGYHSTAGLDASVSKYRQINLD